MLLNYHIGCIFLGLLCAGIRVRFGWGDIRDITPAEPHPNSSTQQSKKNTANVVVQQHSRKLLKMDILMPETCSVRSKVNITSNIKLVFLFFNYHNYARSNKHQIYYVFLLII